VFKLLVTPTKFMTSPLNMEVRTVQRPACPVCSGRGELLYRDQEDSLFGAPGKWSIRKCLNIECGLCWLDPVAIEEDMHRLYADYYTHGEAFVQPGIKAWLRHTIVSVYEWVKLVPLGILGLTAEKRQFSTMFLSDLPPGHILDVGCGDGWFLFRMYRQGWSVTGLDFDLNAIETAKEKYGKYGFELLQTDLIGAHFPDNSFDAVTMNHVIEHVADPIALLAEVKRILKPGGRLVSITPNVQSWGHSLFRECWRGLEIPRHLQILSLPALTNCARRAAFTKIEVKSSAARADMIFGGSYAIRKAHESGTKLRGSRDIELFRALRSSMMQYREAIRWRSHTECGEEAVLICHK
jgi:2-polyprenyl-3-methyl-5-hydroxy-6-metoxy-1,4-benzoquinol methylase